MSLKTTWTAAALAVATVALGGCITVFPQSEPAQLYRFGYGAGGAQPVTRDVNASRTAVLLDTVGMTRAAVGDQILTVAGNQAAYISDARWDAPATLLFTEAVIRAFDERAQRVRLMARPGAGKAQATLRLYVRDLEADYGAITLPPPPRKGERKQPANLPAPTAVVAVRARLIDSAGRAVADRDFVVRRPAADNRVTAIVPAVDGAVTEVLNQLVAWADASAPSSAEVTPRGR